jgi:hypothetical protein
MEEEKSQIIAEFRRVGSRIRLLFCTSAFGMGMDVPDCYCVNFAASGNNENGRYDLLCNVGILPAKKKSVGMC